MIGPTFVSELLTAGLAGLPFSWMDDGEIIDQGLTPEQLVKVNAVVAAHDPSKQRPRAVSGRQLIDALATLGALDKWDAAVSASKKPADRYYWLSAYDRGIPEDSPKLSRIAAAAGVTVQSIFEVKP